MILDTLLSRTATLHIGGEHRYSTRLDVNCMGMIACRICLAIGVVMGIRTAISTRTAINKIASQIRRTIIPIANFLIIT